MQNFGVTNKEHCGMLWYFLEWSTLLRQWSRKKFAILNFNTSTERGLLLLVEEDHLADSLEKTTAQE